MVKLLLEKNAHVDLLNGDGWSSLMCASQNGHCEVVELILEKGAQVCLQDDNGLSGLMLASHRAL